MDFDEKRHHAWPLMTIIETERLCLRFIEPADLDALTKIYADPEGMGFVGGTLDRNETWIRIQRILEWYRRRRFGPYATVLKSTGELIGRCGFLFWTIEGREEVEVGYLLARPFWNQGLATEAVRAIVRYGQTHLHLARMISLIDPENKRSIRVAEKAGLKFEREFTLAPYGTRLIFSVEPHV
jgi:RimJ/RimL family protein N-acetyltransferase